MIQSIKSRLSVKIFLLTFLLTAGCCLITYRFLSWFVPNFYQHDLEEAGWEVHFLSQELSRENRENAYIWLTSEEEVIQELYENEFTLHCFGPDGWEVSLQDIDQPTGRHLTDFDKVEKSQVYTVVFADSELPYTLLLARNTEKQTQMEQALQKSFLPLCAVIFIGSALSAFFYSWYVTAPIKKVSKLSKQMANMDFGPFAPTKRTDEIGVLSNSLQTLSQRLMAALSELQQANQALRADIDTERRLKQQRVEFFAAASHELKTPITIIKGQLQGMLYQVGRYKDRETYLARALEVTDNLENMVQELLTLSRLDVSERVCQKSYIDFERLIRESILAWEDLFVQKELHTEIYIAPGLWGMGDRQLLQKVLDNLLGNAAAYSSAGHSIALKAWEAPDTLHLTVENTGAQIPSESLSHIFEAFYRVEPSRNRQTGGTGLGLYIVKTILGLHGGKIEMENTPQGVLVHVQLPKASSSQGGGS